MNKFIFYRPENLQIMGMSDSETSMEFPYIETKENFHSLDGLKLYKEKKEIKIKFKEDFKIENRLKKQVKKRRNK